jgi:hypothetical protein
MAWLIMRVVVGRWCVNRLAFFAVMLIAFTALPASAMPGHHHHGQGTKNPMKAKYDAVRRTLAEANRAQSANELESANQFLDKAIANLGSDYVSSKAIDDTGMKLTLANAESRSGRLAAAVTLKKRVLESRLEMYRKVHLRD